MVQQEFMKVTATKLASVVIIEPDVFGDERGFYLESYHEEKYRSEVGIKDKFVQRQLFTFI